MADEFTSGEPFVPLDKEEDELERLAGALRTLIEYTATIEAPPDELHQDVDALNELAERLAPYSDAGPFRIRSKRDLKRHWDRNPLVGRLNPIAPPVRMEFRDGGVYGWVTLGSAYEGPPGYAHGGVVASIFDQLLGLANVVVNNPGMTGTMTVRYHEPTPLRTELEFFCKTVNVDGRKSFAQGTCTANGRVTAEGEGLFIALEQEKADRYFSEASGG
ncbi:MAG TPA: PaaI family thioesterase [Actinomycetota bacterium]